MDDLTGVITIFSKNVTTDELVEFCDCIEGHNIEKCYDKFVPKGIQFSMVSCEWYSYEDELDSIYLIAKELFGDIYLEYVEQEKNTICDWYKEEKIMYNKDNDGKKVKTSCEFCYGDCTSNGRNVWVLLKEEIEEEAQKRNISIDWNGEGNLDLYKSGLYPSSEEFYDFCNEILDKNGGLKGTSTIVNDEELIEEIEIMPEKIEMILENSQIYEYVNLEEKIEDKFKEIINDIYIYKNFNKEELLNYIKTNRIVNLKYINKELQDDKEIVLADLKRRVFVNFKHVSERLKDDKTVIKAAIKCGASDFKYASERIKNDKEFVLKVLDYKIDINCIGKSLRNDKDIVEKIKKVFN